MNNVTASESRSSAFGGVASRIAFIVLGVALSIGAVALWMATYPDDSDPKNIYYVLWKHGLNGNMNPDHALGAMTHDTWAVSRVKGLSRDELASRFGYVLTPEQARPYLRLCSNPQAIGELGVHPEGKDVVYLRDSNWMVILNNGRAVDLVLCKGY